MGLEISFKSLFCVQDWFLTCYNYSHKYALFSAHPFSIQHSFSELPLGAGICLIWFSHSLYLKIKGPSCGKSECPSSGMQKWLSTGKPSFNSGLCFFRKGSEEQTRSQKTNQNGTAIMQLVYQKVQYHKSQEQEFQAK